MTEREEFWRARLNEVSPYWPRRLLSLQGDKLVSVERTGESTYGDFEAPTYNILSYTWGRFRTSDEVRVPIENVSWDIPSVKPEHFTTDSFRQVIKRVARGCEPDSDAYQHIWLDIACIHQTDRDQMLEEIGRQAAIFNRARHCFIWLNHTPASSLLSTLELWGSWADKDFWSQVEGEGGLEFIKDWPRKHHEFFSDPWFSSLWTLQEAFLRRDAILLTQEHSPVVARWKWQQKQARLVRLSDLTAACSIFREMLTDGDPDTDLALGPGHRQIYDQAMTLMDKYGLHILGQNSAIELYACSDNRTPSNPLDKIYGIQQIFGISLGRAESLGELEDKLGAALNQINPVLAQAFVHVAEPLTTRTWRITPKIHIPRNVLHVFRRANPIPLCKIDFDSSLAVATFSGPTASFADCVSFWHEGYEDDNWQNDISRDQVPIIHLDRTPTNKARFPAPFFESESMWEGWEDLNMTDALQETFGPRLSVLLVGKAEVHVPRKGNYVSVGVIVHPCNSLMMETWTRIGFVIWDVCSKETSQKEAEIFQQAQNTMHLG